MNRSSVAKIFSFIILTVCFVTALISYSHSRGFEGENRTDITEVSNNADDVKRKYERSFSVKSAGEINVDADAGSISIETWDKNEVSILVEIEGSDSRADKYRVDFKQEGDRISVIGKVKDKSFFKWHVGDLEAYYTIRTPKTFNATVNTYGGNIEVRDLAGKSDYSTSGGNIKVRNLSGETILSTSGGNIEALNVFGDVEGETSGGNVFFQDITGNVKGFTSGGDVEFSAVDGSVKGSTSGGNVTVRIKGENKGVDVETSGGDIDIYIKDGVGADIDAETTGGSVDCDMPVTVRGKVKESELHGKINGGGSRIRANTTGGNIRISDFR